MNNSFLTNFKFLNLFVFVSYFLLALGIMRFVLLEPGTIGFFHDWPFGPFEEMSKEYAMSGLYVWNTQQGHLLHPSDWILKLFLLPISLLGINGETLSKGFLTIALTLAGYAIFFLARKLGLGFVSSFITGMVYVFSPIVFTRVVAGYLYYLINWIFYCSLCIGFLYRRFKDKKY